MCLDGDVLFVRFLGEQMFQDAVWCLVQASDPATAAKSIPAKQPERALGADELSDFFREFRKHQWLNEKSIFVMRHKHTSPNICIRSRRRKDMAGPICRQLR